MDNLRAFNKKFKELK